MKKYCLLFFAGVFALSFSGFSQLKVVSSGNVGVGTSSPGAKLEVTNTDSGIHHCAKFTGPSSLATVLIGGSSQYSYELYVSGDAYSSGGWTSSDEVYKKNIQAVDGNEVVLKLMKVEGKKYEYKSKVELGDILKNDTLRFSTQFLTG
jgi:hypothetical protein